MITRIDEFKAIHENWDRLKNALNGKVDGWDKMTPDEKTEYLHADESRLEIEYQKVFSKGATGGFGNNAKIWVIFGMLMIHLKEIGYDDIIKEMKWRISEHENPIALIKEIFQRIDVSKLNSYYTEEIDKINKLSPSVNPYIDNIPGYEY